VKIASNAILVAEENGEISVIRVGNFSGEFYSVKIMSPAAITAWHELHADDLQAKKPKEIDPDDLEKIKKYFVKKLKSGLNGIIVPLDLLVRGKKLMPITSAQLKKIERKLFAQTLLFKIHEIENF
jgi:hypothetical protein